METRKITVIETKNQRKSIIMSNATTLAELKADLNASNIDYTDMTFYEGLSKTELFSNDSLLPNNINYKGRVTNELVFMLTNTNKKIKSGANEDRMALYEKIKQYNLQEEVKSVHGRNYTMVKTEFLQKIVNDYIAKCHKPNNHTTKTINFDDTVNIDDMHSTLNMLINYLKTSVIIPEVIANTLLNVLNKTQEDKTIPYTDQEIDEMFVEIES